MSFRQEYNGCKTYGCSNSGEPDFARYSLSNRLGYPAWHCELCGAYPPELLNPPILSLAEQIQQSQFEPYFHCDNQRCDCQRCDYQSHATWLRYGKTATGSQRVQCRECHKVKALPNPAAITTTLQPLLDALLSGVKPNHLQRQLGLSSKIFNQRLKQLATLLTQFTRLHEQQHWQAPSPITLQTRSHIQYCRSGLQRQQRSQKQSHAHVWTLATVDASTGYIYLISDNALYPIDIADEEHHSSASQPGIQGTHWLEKSRYAQVHQEPDFIDEPDVLARAEKTYTKILARSQFDQLGYCLSIHASLGEGTLLRPVYAAHAHMQNLHQWLPSHTDINLLLEHESFLRGAAMTAFSHSINRGTTSLYYWHLSCANSQSNAQNDLGRSMSWWNERWHQIELLRHNKQWQVGIGLLTPHKPKSIKAIYALFPNTLDGCHTFWQGFNGWLSPDIATRMSIGKVHLWQQVYRYLYNAKLMKNKRNTLVYSPIDTSSINNLVQCLNDSMIESKSSAF